MHEIDRTWKVGDLARATGLTIRVLHHYDEIGLLVPDRTPSGHRVYGPAEVEWLYRVLALRGAGIALDGRPAAIESCRSGSAGPRPWRWPSSARALRCRVRWDTI